MTDREGILIGRVVIEKYATDETVAVYVDYEELPLIDGLGMAAFAMAHFTSLMERDDDD